MIMHTNHTQRTARHTEMTHDEIIELARAVADGEGWTWLEPVNAKFVRRLLFLRPPSLASLHQLRRQGLQRVA